MKDKFLYIALGDDTKKDIAPSLRMAAMKKGFQQIIPHEKLILINGRAGKRASEIKKIFSLKQINSIKAVYVESSSIGVSFWDVLLIVILKVKKVKMSVFIRDFYPLFRNGWADTNWKGKVANIFWFFNIFLYKFTMYQNYFPSVSSMKLLKMKRKDILPPGLYLDIPTLPIQRNTVFYAGGLRKPYNLTPVFEAVDKLNNELKVEFNLFCRFNDLSYISDWLDKEWLKVEHKSLYDLEYKPHIAIISSDSTYQAIARSVKMLDYIKLGTPILISDAYENSKFLIKHQIGLISDPDSSESFYQQLKKYFTDNELSERLENNVLKVQKSSELNWLTRCEKVLNDLDYNY